MKRLKTRLHASGYREYQEPTTGEWIPVHRRVAEKKWGNRHKGRHVHHRNQIKTDNRRANLLHAHPRVHGRLHALPDVCARCGREGHWARDCYATTFWDGQPLRGRGRRSR